MSYDEVESGQVNRYDNALSSAKQASDRNPTLRLRIQFQRKYHEEELARLAEIEKLLDENPAIEKFQDLMTKTRGL